MGFINKIKNILFEEEEVEIPVIKKEEKPVVKREEPKKIEIEPEYPSFTDLEDDAIIEDDTNATDFNDIQFDFPSFDEDEFDNFIPQVNNVKKEEKKEPRKQEIPEVKNYSYTSKYNTSEVKSSYELPREDNKKKFKPSPNISPVYGILDKDYKLEDIMPRRKEEKKFTRRELDVDRVRKKAFGELEDDIELTFSEPKEAIKEEIIAEKERYNELKGKTIDELLMESSDEEIDVKPQREERKVVREEVKEIPRYEEEKSLEVLDNKTKEKDVEDTLENDLFNLIDSMYEDRKGE
ncbi:MAG: hypothetical protein IJ574_01465 [Bacilli bacterium]|nr:hypothetical protein [Bacilli bacterium]